jgi:hypothetical protein
VNQASPTIRKTTRRIPTAIVPSVPLNPAHGRIISREFKDLLDAGAKLRVAGAAKHDPQQLLTLGYQPQHKIELFDNQFYLSGVRQNPELRFLVAYVVPPSRANRGREIFARIFYKDLSLVWRCASHFSHNDGLWIGKGDTYVTIEDGHEIETSRESTTDLPIEMQAAMEALLQYHRKPNSDGQIIELVLRQAPADRIRPYADFTRPRQRAVAAGNQINGGRSIARFTRAGDPTSLRISRGYEPDFSAGIIDVSHSKSRLYHGPLQRYRILSTNRKIQYVFMAGPQHVWIIPPQATTTQLSSYGVRTVDVIADDDLFIPGYEYHYVDEDQDGQGDSYSQIPAGYAGSVSDHDDQKADASPWLDKIPVIQAFRRQVLKQN